MKQSKKKGAFKPISTSTAYRIGKATAVTSSHNVRVRPLDRSVQISDVRNIIAEYALLHKLLHPIPEKPDWTVDPALVISMDPCRIEVDDDDTTRCVGTPDSRKTRFKMVRVGKDDKPFSTSYISFFTNKGTAPMVLLLFSDSQVDAGDAHRIDLEGLGATPDAIGEMWVVRSFHDSKKKNTPEQGTDIFQKIFDLIVLPMFAKAFTHARKNQRAEGVEFEERGIFQFDGQLEMIKMLERPGNIKKLEDDFIDAMKHSAGCSLGVQINDVMKTFPVIKSGIKTHKYAGDSDLDLVKKANKKIDDLKKTFPKITTQTTNRMKKVFRIIQPVLGPALNPHIILTGGIECGAWHPWIQKGLRFFIHAEPMRQ